MRKGLTFSGLFALAALSLAAAAPQAAKPTAAIGQEAPGFTLNDQNGKPVSLSDYKGKVVVLEWTNKECPFVQRHLKAKTMIDLSEKYKAQGVVWMAIDTTQTHNTAINHETVNTFKLPYPILDDSQGTVGRDYSAKSTPDMFIINKDGTLVYSGAIDNDPAGDRSDRINYVAKALDEVLAGKSVSTAETKSYGCGVKYKD